MKQKALKLLSLICALALMLSVVSVGFVAFAAEGTITLTETSNDATIPEGENLLANGDFSFALKDTSNDGIYSHDMGSGYADYKAKLTDDILEVTGQTNRAVWTNSNFTAANLGNNDGSREKNYFYQVVVDIKGTADIEKFYLFGLQGDYTPMRYDVSFASSEADLFTANATSYYYDYQDNGGVFRGQIFDVANVNARYVGIRAYRLGSSATFYLSEIGVIGSNFRELPSVKAPVTTNSVYLPEGENLIDENTEFSFKTVYDNGGTKTTVEHTRPHHDQNAATYKTYMTDGIYTDAEGAQRGLFAGWDSSHYTLLSAANLGNTTGGKDYYYELTADLKRECSIESFFMIGMNTSYVPVRYDISFANSKDDLFTANAITGSYDYSGTATIQQTFEVVNVEAQFFGVRVYELKGNATWYAYEIGVIGSGEYPAWGKLVTNSGDAKLQNAQLPEGTNLLSLASYSASMNYASVGTSLTFTNNLSTWHDNDSQTNAANETKLVTYRTFDGSNKGNYYQITYALDKTYTLSNFALGATEYDGYQPTMYEIFASDDEISLYDEENCLYSFDNRSGSTSKGQVIEIKNSGEYNYFGIRVYAFGKTGLGVMYINELKLTGEEVSTEPEPEIATTSALTSVDGSYDSVYGPNRLANAELSYKIVEADSNNNAWTNTPNPRILTSNSSNDIQTIQTVGGIGTGDVATNQKREYVELTFKTSAIVENPEKLMLTYRNAGEGIKFFEFFASKTEEDLFNSSVYEYKSSDVSGWQELHIDLSGFKLDEVKYFGFRFYELNSKQYISIRELAIYGGELGTGAKYTAKTDEFADYSAYGISHLAGSNITA